VSAPAVLRVNGRGRDVLAIRAGIIAVLVVVWELASASGLFYRDVVPSLLAVGRAVAGLVAGAEFYRHLGVTLLEIATAMGIGGVLGLLAGLVLGGSRFLSQAFEHYLHYLGPTPKIIFFPVMIMWFGVGSGSKVAMGALSCFFPIALSVASGMRQINPVLLRVGRSFKASRWQTTTKIHLPAMRAPILNGIRLGLGVAIIGTLLAETKLSNAGVGYLVMQAYSIFDMPGMYALLFVLFTLAIGANAVVGRLAGPQASPGD
jgi:ABC-type nitrate/sulfonate/bicarbonate transport system permease component